MKALFFEKHGELDVLRYGDVPDPAAASGQVVVRVKACALNYKKSFWRTQGARQNIL